MGISGKILNVVEDFLSERTFGTFVGEAFYSFIRCPPSQGFVLGLLLFVIFINDLPDSIYGISKLFADDQLVIVDANDCMNCISMLENLLDIGRICRY